MPNVAIISTTSKVNFTSLKTSVDAITKQVRQDVTKYWNPKIYTALLCDINCYESLDKVPYNSWVVTIDDDIGIDVYGYHYIQETDKPYAQKGTPYAQLRYDASLWTLILSHELIELLLNPYLRNFRYSEIGGKKVRIVVEPSDPAQFKDFGYKIDGVLVSDFTTPEFYDFVYTPNTQYSFTGQIKKPLELLENGYFSFQYLDRLEVWFQMWKVRGQTVTKELTDKVEENPKTTLFIVFILIVLFVYSKR